MLIPPLGGAIVVEGFTAAMTNVIGDPSFVFPWAPRPTQSRSNAFWGGEGDRVVEMYGLAIDRL
jgi:hypothetical protein